MVNYLGLKNDLVSYLMFTLVVELYDSYSVRSITRCNKTHPYTENRNYKVQNSITIPKFQSDFCLISYCQYYIYKHTAKFTVEVLPKLGDIIKHFKR